MKIDILSDIHIDLWHDPHTPLDPARFNELFTPVLPKNKGDILIISGDLGHYHTQNLEILKRLRKYYKAIVYIWGNHDFYLVDTEQIKSYESGFAKAKELREMIHKEEGLYHLDGEIVEIDGIRFGGCTAWYDNAFMGEDKEANQALWHERSKDSKVKGFEDFSYDDLHKIDLIKLDAIYQKCDVMITHTCPFLGEHGKPFYYFDADKYLKNGTMKFWIYGHTHQSCIDQKYNVTLITNTLGRPSEKKVLNFCQIEI